MCVSSYFSSNFSSGHAVYTLSENSLSQVITDILATGTISAASQAYLLNLTRSDKTLSGQDVVLINRVFHRLQMGLLRVVPD